MSMQNISIAGSIADSIGNVDVAMEIQVSSCKSWMKLIIQSVLKVFCQISGGDCGITGNR